MTAPPNDRPNFSPQTGQDKAEPRDAQQGSTPISDAERERLRERSPDETISQQHASRESQRAAWDDTLLALPSRKSLVVKKPDLPDEVEDGAPQPGDSAEIAPAVNQEEIRTQQVPEIQDDARPITGPMLAFTDEESAETLASDPASMETMPSAPPNTPNLRVGVKKGGRDTATKVEELSERTVGSIDELLPTQRLSDQEISGAEATHPSRDDNKVFPPANEMGQPDFMLETIIGRGGQGEVWDAWQSSLQRRVAVKCLRAGDVAEFLQESYTSGELDHPNIVPVYDLGRMHDGERELPLLAMKRIQGDPWSRILDEERSNPNFSYEEFLVDNLKILADVCNAVAYAHSKKIIHRDLKPSQVMVGHFGEVFLMDWGLAVSVDNNVPTLSANNLPKHSTLNTASNRCGSPAYMAPEQTLDSTDELGFHTDIYLLGAILYEIVKGHPPHAAETAEGAYYMAVLNEYEPLGEDVPEELAKLIEASLAMETDQRPGSAETFRDRIEDYLTGAGRQRESREIVRNVEAALEKTPLQQMDYSHVTQSSQRLSRALQLWPDYPRAEQLRQGILARHAHLALESGDLQLAYSLAGSLADDDERAYLLLAVSEARAAKERGELQRRILLGVTLILTVTAFTIMAVSLIRQARSDKKQAEQMLAVNREIGRRQVHMDRAAQTAELLEMAKERNELVEAVLQLQEDENRLALKLEHIAPFPQTVFIQKRTNEANQQAHQQLLKEREALAEKRAAYAEAGAPMMPEPLGLLLGEANYLLQMARKDEELEAVRALYRKAAEEYPGLPEPIQGVAIADARLGYLEGAARLLTEATEVARIYYGEDDLEFARALNLEAENLKVISPEDERYVVLRNEALAILRPRWEELSETLVQQYESTGRVEEAKFFKGARETAPPAPVE